MRGDAAWRARGHAPGMPSACPRRAAAKAKAAPMGRQPRHGVPRLVDGIHVSDPDVDEVVKGGVVQGHVISPAI